MDRLVLETSPGDGAARNTRPKLFPVAVAIAFVVVSSGCGAGLQQGDAQVQGAQPWVRAVYPVTDDAPVRVDRYDHATTLVRGGRIYGSDADNDLRAQVVGMAAALAFSAEGPSLLRVGQVGFGAGTSVAVALGAGSRTVDVFERDGHIVAAAEAISDVSGLTFQDDTRRPIHPALRLVPPEQAVQERFLRYDVLLSPPATSVIASPHRLITVERLENLIALLNSDGVLVHHLPAYDMQPETYRRLLRTFAHVFPNMVVVSAGRYASDTFLVGSASPLRLEVENLNALANAPGLDDLIEIGHLSHPFDLAARVVFASRQEVLAFTQNAEPISASAPLPASATPARPPVPAPDAPEAEQAAWREALEQHRQRFQRMEMLRDQMYDMDWPHGQLCPEDPDDSSSCLVAGFEANERGAEQMADLALSLMAAGRFVEAQVILEDAAAIARGALVTNAQRVLRLLLDEPPELTSRLPDALEPALTALRDGQCDQALAASAELAPDSASTSHEERLVAAYSLARCQPEDLEAAEQVARLIAPVAEDDATVSQYPEALYLLARSAMILGQYELATWTMVAYVSRAEPLSSEDGGDDAPPRRPSENTPTPS